MIIISDTTPIISLLKIEKIELLRDLFGVVVVPVAVYNELTSNPNFRKEAQIVKDCLFIKKGEIKNFDSVNDLMRSTGLDLGESKAIIFAEELKDTLLLIDESKGRIVAKNLGIKITGTIGLLLEAYDSNIIGKTDLLVYIKTLKDNNRFISENLYQKILDRIQG